ncbi:MAG: 2,3-bisphosphoglycerate-independent phosphoglycerate mutase [Candidatus Bilamarchaeaceae archaeon]
MGKGILLIMDGLGDLQDGRGRTPLSAAKKPNMDRMAKGGILGMLSPIGRGNVPGSDTSHLTILGYPYWEFYCGRGPLEALGAGIKLQKGDVALRANFATVRNGRIVDRRAGRMPTELGKKLQERIGKMNIEGVEATFFSTVEHRGVVVMRGGGLSADISSTDPHELGPVLESSTFKQGAEKTARVLNQFTKKAMELLSKAPENKGRGMPANAVLCRGAGVYREVQPFESMHGIRGACVAGGALYKGVAKYIGMGLVEASGATATKDTDLKGKGNAALKALQSHDFVFVHVKATDSFSHDGDFEGKRKMIEKVDRELVPLLLESGENIIITGDHSTVCKLGKHTGDEVPLLAFGPGFRTDAQGKFSELACMGGGLGHIDGWDVMPIMLNAMGKARMVGA